MSPDPAAGRLAGHPPGTGCPLTSPLTSLRSCFVGWTSWLLRWTWSLVPWTSFLLHLYPHSHNRLRPDSYNKSLIPQATVAPAPWFTLNETIVRSPLQTFPSKAAVFQKRPRPTASATPRACEKCKFPGLLNQQFWRRVQRSASTSFHKQLLQELLRCADV